MSIFDIFATLIKMTISIVKSMEVSIIVIIRFHRYKDSVSVIGNKLPSTDSWLYSYVTCLGSKVKLAHLGST